MKTRLTRSSIPAASLLIFWLSGCTPSVNSVTVTAGSDVNLVNVQASIGNAPAASMGTPVLRVASLANNPSSPVFRDVTGFAPTSGGNYQKDSLALPAGQFRFEVQQPYTPVFTTGQQTVSKTQDFTVTIPQGCFFFDGSTEGWTTDGFFELQTSSPIDLGTRVPLCSGQNPVISDAGLNFPLNSPPVLASPFASSFHSLAVPLDAVTNACFTQPAPPVPQDQFVSIDLISPDLSTLPGWTTANGFDVQAKGANIFGAPSDAQVQMQLLLKDTAGNFFRPVDPAPPNAPSFTSLGGPFAAASFALPNKTLSQIRIRLFVPKLTGVVPGIEVNIDRVCPKTAS